MVLDAYLQLPAWLRLIVAAGILSAGVGMTYLGASGRSKHSEQTLTDGRVVETDSAEVPGARSLFRLGMVTSGIGAVLFLTCGKSDAEKRGYNF